VRTQTGDDMRHPESYIVRIYVNRGAREFAGTVEIVRTSERHGFSNGRDLLDILVSGRNVREGRQVPARRKGR